MIMENKENEQEQVITPEQEVEKDNTAAETASAAEETQDSKEAELKWDSADDLAKKLEETEKKLADMEKLRLLALAETENQRKRSPKNWKHCAIGQFRIPCSRSFRFLTTLPWQSVPVKGIM